MYTVEDGRIMTQIVLGEKKVQYKYKLHASNSN